MPTLDELYDQKQEQPGASKSLDELYATKPAPAAPTTPLKPTIGSYVSKFDQDIQAAAKHFGVDVNAIRALHFNEERTDQPALVNPRSGATGPMQIEPSTFKAYADPGADIKDPVANIKAGANYFSTLLKQYNGDYHKAFATYNLGHYDATDVSSNFYARQAEANLKYLQGDVKDRTVASVFKPVKKPPAPKPVSTSLDSLPFPNAPDANDKIDSPVKAAEGAAENVINLLHSAQSYFGSAIWNHLSDETKKALTEFHDSTPAKGTMGFVGYVGQLAQFFPTVVDTALRMGAGGDNATSQFRYDLLKAIKDPGQSEKFLNLMNSFYEPLSGQDKAFWHGQPGLTDAIAQMSKKVSKQDIGVSALEVAAGAYADTSRFLEGQPALRDTAAFMIGWYNPMNRVPGSILRPTAGKAAGAAGEAFREHAPDVKAAYTAAVSAAPFGDRFYKTKVAAQEFHRQRGVPLNEAKKLGEEAAAQHMVAVYQQAAVGAETAPNFYQENKLGKLNKEQKLRLQMYQEKFNNVQATAHIHQPDGGDHVTLDPVTKAAAMSVGGLHGVEYDKHLEHKFVYWPTLMGSLKTRPQARKVLNTLSELFASPKDAKTFYKSLAKQDWEGALGAHPTITQEAVEEFMAATAQKTAGMPEKDARDYMEQATIMRVVGEEARNKGIPIQLRSSQKGIPDRLVFGTPVRALERDHQPLDGGLSGTSTMDERSFYTTELAEETRNILKTIAPKTAKVMVPGLWSRAASPTAPGMFENEPSLKEALTANLSNAVSRRGVNSGITLESKKRIYDSLEEAFDAGEEINPRYQPDIPMIEQQERARRLINFIGSILPHTKEIDYDKYSLGVLEDRLKEPMKPTGEQDMSHMGASGKERLSSAITRQATASAERRMGEMAWSALKPDDQKSLIDHEAAKLWQQVEDNFKRANPGMIWDLNKATTGIEDFEGLTAPGYITDMHLDAHPSTHSGGRDRLTLMEGAVHPAQKIQNGIEMFENMFRTAFLSTLPYHLARNIAWLAFRYGHLNPIEVSQAFFAPHTISSQLHEEIAELKSMGGQSHAQPQLVTTPAQARYRSAADPRFQQPGVNQYKNVANVIPRTKAMLDSFKRVYDPDLPALQNAAHVFGNAYYHGSKWTQDTVFGLGENAFEALTYKKFKERGYSKAQAFKKTRDLMGNKANLTEIERAGGLARMFWFFNWFKTQMRLGFANAYTTKGLAGSDAINNALSVQNTNDPKDRDPSGASKYGEMTLGGAEVNVAPPTQTYDLLARNMGGSVTNWGQGILDFDDFMTHHAATALEPSIKPILEQAPNTLALGQNAPKIPMMNQSVLGNDAEAMLSALDPQVRTALIKGVNDPLKLLDTFGFQVSRYNAPLVTVYRDAIITSWKGTFGPMYADAKTPQEKQRALGLFYKANQRYIDKLKTATDR